MQTYSKYCNVEYVLMVKWLDSLVRLYGFNNDVPTVALVMGLVAVYVYGLCIATAAVAAAVAVAVGVGLFE